MTQKPCCTIDICNTLADINHVLDNIGPVRPKGTYLHPAVTYDGFFRDNLWIFNCAKPKEGSKEVLELISERYQIIYLTARPQLSELITRRWLNNNHYPPGRIIYSDNKSDVALSLNARFAIDDSPQEVYQYKEAGILCFVPAADYNTSCSNRFDWSYLFKLLSTYGASVLDMELFMRSGTQA